MISKRLSLAGQLTALFAVGTLLIVIANAVFATVSLQRSMEQELELLLERELTAIDSEFFGEQYTTDFFATIVTARLNGHGERDLAWRVWNTDTGEVWHDFGATELIADADPSIDDRNETRSSGRLRWRTQLLRSGYVVSVIVNGNSRFELIAKYEKFAVERIVLSAAFAALISWLFLRRVSGQLRRIAADLRAESSGAPRLSIVNPPREIQALAEALRERLSRVQVASEQAQLFTASLAHELRSPIQNLIGETEVALIAPRDAATYRAVLESNLHELRELGDAVDNLMTICTQRGSDSKVLREEFDLGDEAEIRLARERSRGRLVDVELEIRRGGNTRLVGDREALLRALRNLAGNAIDFSPPGSRVEVTIEGGPESIEIAVDDQGPGVPTELRERIFEPFFTGPAKRGGRVGYGLGLAIARTAVIGQGGTIEVANGASGGASFRLTLPRRPGRTGLVDRDARNGRRA